jgi:hypothetical protein
LYTAPSNMTMIYILIKSDQVAISFTKFKSTEGINDMVPKQQRNNLLSPYQNSQMSIISHGQKNYYKTINGKPLCTHLLTIDSKIGTSKFPKILKLIARKSWTNWLAICSLLIFSFYHVRLLGYEVCEFWLGLNKLVICYFRNHIIDA